MVRPDRDIRPARAVLLARGVQGALCVPDNPRLASARALSFCAALCRAEFLNRPTLADPDDWDGPEFDWPPYREIREDDETIEHVRRMYASLLTMCDAMLGRVLDLFDKHDLWKDTMLIVNVRANHALLEF